MKQFDIDICGQLIDSLNMLKEEFERASYELRQMQMLINCDMDDPHHDKLYQSIEIYQLQLNRYIENMKKSINWFEEVFDKYSRLDADYKGNQFVFPRFAVTFSEVKAVSDEVFHEVKSDIKSQAKRYPRFNYKILNQENIRFYNDEVGTLVTWEDADNKIHQFAYKVSDRITFSVVNGFYLSAPENILVTSHNYHFMNKEVLGILSKCNLNSKKDLEEITLQNKGDLSSRRIVLVIFEIIRSKEKQYKALEFEEYLSLFRIAPTVKINGKFIHSVRSFYRTRDYALQVQDYARVSISGIGTDVI